MQKRLNIRDKPNCHFDSHKRDSEIMIVVIVMVIRISLFSAFSCQMNKHYKIGLDIHAATYMFVKPYMVMPFSQVRHKVCTKWKDTRSTIIGIPISNSLGVHGQRER